MIGCARREDLRDCRSGFDTGGKPQSFMFLRHTRENENGAVIGLFGFDTVLKPRISQIIHRLAQIIRGSPQGSEQ